MGAIEIYSNTSLFSERAVAEASHKLCVGTVLPESAAARYEGTMFGAMNTGRVENMKKAGAVATFTGCDELLCVIGNV